MAPDRGSSAKPVTRQAVSQDEMPGAAHTEPLRPEMDDGDTSHTLVQRASEEQNFTLRGVLLGLAIGVVICFSNMYFGLQTGWVSGMAMPAALVGFAFFKSIVNHIKLPFTPVENVLVQTVAGAVGTMPLGCGFVGVIPALEFLLEKREGGPLNLGFGRLVLWAVGICFFGVFVAVPLRKEVLIREKLKFPSGTATALMIGVLHGETRIAERSCKDQPEETTTTLKLQQNSRDEFGQEPVAARDVSAPACENDEKSDWHLMIRSMILAFGASAFYTLLSYFLPFLHHLPVFGTHLATNWLWTLNPSPAYVGQGIIMGSTTTLHMLLGAILGWSVLSPLAKNSGWAPGPVEDWKTGSKGWIVWISLAIMLADSLVNLSWLVIKMSRDLDWLRFSNLIKRGQLPPISSLFSSKVDYAPLSAADLDNGPRSSQEASTARSTSSDLPPAPSSGTENTAEADDAPPEHIVSTRSASIGFSLSLVICAASLHIVFPAILPLYATILAIAFSLLLSVMGVRALGETDLNPVSGISKLTQLVFALVVPASNPHAVAINLVAGAVSESAALQAGDMMQDLKTGHLLGASPAAQFYGQLIGSLVGAVVSAGVYKLYTSVYRIPSDLFQIPTGFVWVFTARLVTGQGLPPMAWQYALGAGLIFAVITAARIRGQGCWWQAWLPGGIAVAVGMYNTPSFTLARTIGGVGSALWTKARGGREEDVVVLAAGLVLGEGLVSILNLGLASLHVPHL